MGDSLLWRWGSIDRSTSPAGRGTADASSMRRLLEMFIAVDVMGETHRIEARLLAAMIAGRTAFAVERGDLVLGRVTAGMHDAIDARMLDRIAGLVFSRRHRPLPFAIAASANAG